MGMHAVDSSAPETFRSGLAAGRPRTSAHLSGLLENIVALYAVYIAGRVAPLLTIPYLARVLGQTHWGIVALAQALSVYVALVIEFGFNLSATREMARVGGSPERRAELFAGVNGAKLVLTFPCVALAVGFVALNPVLQERPLIVAFAILAGITQGFSPLWYFQGMEQIRVAAAIDVAGRLFGSLAVLGLVTSPENAWRLFAVQSAASVACAIAMCCTAGSELRFQAPCIAGVTSALRMGWSLFLFRAAASLYTVGNALILGCFVPPQQVGLYVGAEKISKACFSLLGPFGEALYPRLSRLRHTDRDGADHLTRLSLRVTAFLGGFIGLMLVLFAPVVIRVVLGSGYEDATPVLRLLAALPPLIAISSVLGIQWMLPEGMDRCFNATIVGAGLLNVLLATFLAQRAGAMGMAAAVVAAEFAVTAAFSMFLFRHMRSKAKREDPVRI